MSAAVREGMPKKKLITGMHHPPFLLITGIERDYVIRFPIKSNENLRSIDALFLHFVFGMGQMLSFSWRPPSVSRRRCSQGASKGGTREMGKGKRKTEMKDIGNWA